MEEFLQSFINLIMGIVNAIREMVAGFRDLNDDGGLGIFKKEETTEANG